MPAQFDASRRKQRSLQEALSGGRWVSDLRGRVTAELLPGLVQLWTATASIHLSATVDDVFRWRRTENGIFSVNSAYKLQFMGSTRSPLMGSIWRAWAPAKCRLFAWLFAQNRLLTADRLMARQWPNSYFCPLCRRNLETAGHLMIERCWSRWLWDLAAIRFGPPSLSPGFWTMGSSLVDWLIGLSAEQNAPRARSLSSLVARVLETASEDSGDWALAGGRHLWLG